MWKFDCKPTTLTAFKFASCYSFSKIYGSEYLVALIGMITETMEHQMSQIQKHGCACLISGRIGESTLGVDQAENSYSTKLALILGDQANLYIFKIIIGPVVLDP